MFLTGQPFQLRQIDIASRMFNGARFAILFRTGSETGVKIGTLKIEPLPVIRGSHCTTKHKSNATKLITWFSSFSLKIRPVRCLAQPDQRALNQLKS